MNITRMPVQDLKQAQKPKCTKVPDELSNVFQDILQKSKPKIENASNTSSQSELQDQSILLKDHSLPKEIEEQLAKLFKETDDTNFVLENMNLSPTMLQELKELLRNMAKVTASDSTNEDDILQQLKEILGNMTNSKKGIQLQMDTTGMTPNVNTIVIPINRKEIQLQLGEIRKKAESLLSSIENQKSIAKIAPEIQKLLEQWSSLAKKLVGTKESTIIQTGNPDTGKNQKVDSIWRELTVAYQKKEVFMNSQRYSTNAKVTSADVEKWIGKALSKQSISDNFPANQIGASTMPISKVEQYIIHLNQAQSTQNTGQQLVDKFQEVMSSSKFLSLKNGATQLSISLRPANLGEMMVKFTQINGEMTVKIMVASTAVKDMLESNMHQLKHMFSPQQVVIEKQDINQQAQNMQQENEQQSMNQHDQGQSEQSSQDQQKHSSDDFEKQFNEILMNEKV